MVCIGTILAKFMKFNFFYYLRKTMTSKGMSALYNGSLTYGGASVANRIKMGNKYAKDKRLVTRLNSIADSAGVVGYLDGKSKGYYSKAVKKGKSKGYGHTTKKYKKR